MKNVYRIVCFAILLLPAWGAAQNRFVKKANQKFEAQEYQESVKFYEKAVQKGAGSLEVFRKLSDAYLHLSLYEKAADTYAKIWPEYKDSLEVQYAFRYALALKSKGAYKKSDSIMLWYANKVEADNIIAQQFRLHKDYLKSKEAYQNNFEVSFLESNSKAFDFAPSIQEGKLIYATDRDAPKSNKLQQTRLRWLQQEVHTASNAVPFLEALQRAFNPSSLCFSKAGDTLYFTSNNNNGKKYLRDEKGFSRLRIFRSVRIHNQWEEAVQLPLCKNTFSAAHPSLSADGKRLYFVSNMPGGYGETDIYFVKLYADGTFSKPINVGAPINTEASESYPFLGANGELYFSSDGHPGLGGMDIFFTDLLEKENKQIHHLGKSVNSKYDDIGICFDTNYTIGFLASDRKRTSNMDIFSLKHTKDANFEKRMLDAIKPAELEVSEVVENSAYDPSQVKDAIVAPELVYDIPTILFDFDASQLGASAKSILDEVSEFLQKNQSVKLLVIGHTDRIGASSYNQRLSVRRAQSVRDYLLSKNIATQRLRILGQGENKLKHPCTSCTQEQHRENRRVEMEIMSKEN